MNRSPEFRLGFDIGGTFTDAVVTDVRTGKHFIAKSLTTPADPSVGALTAVDGALNAADIRLPDIAVAIHGMTLVSNALLQRHGARTALITTQGFRDVLEIAREIRYDVYRLTAPFPTPLVPRQYRYEVPERMLANGEVYEPLDRDAAIQILRQIKHEELDAIAVCFLHAYRNPAHELEMAELIQECLPGIPFSLSSEVVAEFREYERTSTTVANAYTQPLIRDYLSSLERELRNRGFRDKFYVMMSTGGITPVETAIEFPIRLVESGPAAGALATAYYGVNIGEDHLLSFDMGGTTAKACIIDHGMPTRTKYFEVAREERFIKGSGLAVRSPVIDMIEIGAGGGSIAKVDNLGLLRVGPKSAEADPGPACYGLGGTQPTVTDANLVLGFLNPDYFLGGTMQIYPDLAEAAIQEHIAGPLGLSLTDAAWGIFQVVCENMASAARVHFADKGRDPRQYSLFAYGGGGPLHATAIARRLRMNQVLAPIGAGVLSAFGFLTAPASFDFIRTHITRLDRANWSEINEIYQEMEVRGRDVLRDAHVPAGEQQFIRTADMRYVGQLYEITVPVPEGRLTSESRAHMEDLFHATYHDIYGRHDSATPVEVLTWRLLATGPTPNIPLEEDQCEGRATLDQARKGTRLAYFGDHGGWGDAAVYDRYRLPSGVPGNGPAILEERESTIIVPPGGTFVIDSNRVARVRLES